MSAAKPGSSGLRLAIDYAPLILFVAVTFLAPDKPLMQVVAATTSALDDMDRIKALVIARVLVATVTFMVATIVAMVVSRVKLGSISPMLWISGALVIVFGGLTLIFRDPRFIQMKPTFVYALFAAILGFGYLTRRPLLQQLLGSAYPGLSEPGWLKVTRNWALFFVCMAVLNEIVWRNTSLQFWAGFKLWGAIPLTMLFAFANVPMMMKHGLMSELPPE
jgi:intracellular septation protein